MTNRLPRRSRAVRAGGSPRGFLVEGDGSIDPVVQMQDDLVLADVDLVDEQVQDLLPLAVVEEVPRLVEVPQASGEGRHVHFGLLQPLDLAPEVVEPMLGLLL